MDIGIFYASTTGNTEDVAHLIAEQLGDVAHLHDIAHEGVSALGNYPCLILGIPTWDFGELQEDWAEHWQALQNMSFVGKRIALFGLGDQIGYGEWFVDAMGMLADVLLERGGELVAPWSVEGYSFEASKALNADGTHFVGLALDEDGQHAETAERVALWLDEVCKAFEKI
ncbi:MULTISPECIES: flavodoxin [Nitrincola]|uniref:flavodoxin n=1 Tax=Nitrincola TaxID=267849 RepID=UPI0004B81487|nr:MULTISPECIES: flavodoxin [Nitrincola]